MELKKNGMPLKKINLNYRFTFIKSLLFVLFFISCNGQENKSLIGKQYKSISDLADQKYKHKNSNYIQSNKISNFLNTNSSFFRSVSGNTIERTSLIIIEFVVCESKIDIEIGKKRDRYLFIEERLENTLKLKDTLKIAKGLDYSQVLLSTDKKQFGICIGKYLISKQGDEFFEISLIYSINKEGKLVKKPLNTVVYDCPAPLDYIRDEEPNSYRFGVEGGKKFERDWYKN